MRVTFDVPDGSEAAEIVAAYARENGIPTAVAAGFLFQGLLEKRPHGLREPGSVAKRVEERKRKEADARKAEADRRKREAEAKQAGSPVGDGADGRQSATGPASATEAKEPQAGKPQAEGAAGSDQAQDEAKRRRFPALAER